MFPSKKTATNSHEGPLSYAQGDSGLVLTTDPKPRLRWTVELHDRFVDAITQLGGPDKATPKTIMRVMGVKGLTLYHLKSHLQKFRLGKQLHKDLKDLSSDALDLRRLGGCSSGTIGRTMAARNTQTPDALRMQLEVQRRLHDQIEVQKSLQMRIEAQGKYMQSILDKACQALTACENIQSNTDACKTFSNHGSMHQHDMPKHMTTTTSSSSSKMAIIFPSLQDFHLFSPHQPRNDDSATASILLGSKKSQQHGYYSNQKGKDTLVWNDHEFIGAESNEEEDREISCSVISGSMDMESVMDVFDGKVPMHTTARESSRKTSVLAMDLSY